MVNREPSYQALLNKNEIHKPRLEIYENIEFELEKLLDLRKTAGQINEIGSEQVPTIRY